MPAATVQRPAGCGFIDNGVAESRNLATRQVSERLGTGGRPAPGSRRVRGQGPQWCRHCV